MTIAAAINRSDVSSGMFCGNGMVFMTMEDETGMINLVVRPDTFERQRALIISENLLMVRGKLQRQGEAMSILARQFFPLSLGKPLETSSRDFR